MAVAVRRPVALPVVELPRTRGDCIRSIRPCPHTTCRHHLNAASDSCSLDVADRGGATLDEVGEMFGVSRERIRQLENQAIRKLREAAAWLAENKS